MKIILFLLLVAMQCTGYSQGVSDSLLPTNHIKDSLILEIRLSNTLDETRMGVWENGDYKIYVEITPLEERFRNDYVSLINTMEKEYKNDSVTLSRYKIYADRYLIATNRLKAAENGFDLRSLVVYVGPDNEEQNKGNSYLVDLLVRQLVESGNSAIYYKGERVFVLKKQIYWDYIMSHIKVYYNQNNNCAYNYIGHINW